MEQRALVAKILKLPLGLDRVLNLKEVRWRGRDLQDPGGAIQVSKQRKAQLIEWRMEQRALVAKILKLPAGLGMVLNSKGVRWRGRGLQDPDGLYKWVNKERLN